MGANLRVATDVALIVMVVVWLAYVAYLVWKDRQQKPVDIIISTSPTPSEP